MHKIHYLCFDIYIYIYILVNLHINSLARVLPHMRKNQGDFESFSLLKLLQRGIRHIYATIKLTITTLITQAFAERAGNLMASSQAVAKSSF